MQFGLTFDLRGSHNPKTEAEAVKYVRLWAAREGVEIPEGIEPTIIGHDADPNLRRSFPSLYVGFEWDV
jgi:hypothetical protein